MNWSEFLCDIGVNFLSDILFVVVIGLVLVCHYRRELSRARSFFGFRSGKRLRIFVSAHEDKHTFTKGVVTAVEYEAAAQVRRKLRELSGAELIRMLAGLIGQDPRLPEPDIDVSPLKEVTEPLRFPNIVLLGGPLRNQLTAFYSRTAQPLLRFDLSTTKYSKRVGQEYQELSEPDFNAIIVKATFEQRVVFFVFGDGEEETKGAARFLAQHWKALRKRFRDQAFGIGLDVSEAGVVEKVALVDDSSG